MQSKQTHTHTNTVHGGVVLSVTEASLFVLNQPWCSKATDICCLAAVKQFWPACVLCLHISSNPEKGKRAKSGSAGEASSNSPSERSNSLGSLKGTGKQTKYWQPLWCSFYFSFCTFFLLHASMHLCCIAIVVLSFKVKLIEGGAEQWNLSSYSLKQSLTSFVMYWNWHFR